MSSYYTSLTSFLEGFRKEFGERTFNSIYDKIASSNKVAGLIKISRERQISVSSDDIVPCVMSMIGFMFSSKIKVALAAVLVLERWNKECNSQLLLMEDDDLYYAFQSILKSCGEMV